MADGPRNNQWSLLSAAVVGACLLVGIAVLILGKPQEEGIGSERIELQKAVSRRSPYLAEMMKGPVVDLVHHRLRYCRALSDTASTITSPRNTVRSKLCKVSEATRSVVFSNFQDVANGRLPMNRLYYFELHDPESQEWMAVGIFSSQLQCEDIHALAAEADLASKPCRPWRAILADTW